MASLMSRGDTLRDVIRATQDSGGIVAAAYNIKFRLGPHVEDGSYGITIEQTVSTEVEDKRPIRLTNSRSQHRKPLTALGGVKVEAPRLFWGYSTVISGEQSVVIAAFVLTTGLLAMILYCQNTSLNISFQQFMDSQSFGVRALFSVSVSLLAVPGIIVSPVSSSHAIYQIYLPDRTQNSPRYERLLT